MRRKRVPPVYQITLICKVIGLCYHVQMKEENENTCPATRLFTLLSRRHMLLMLYTLTGGEKRFVELEESLHINTASLSMRLRELESAHLIARRQCAEDSRQHYYFLTKTGVEISRLIEKMSAVAQKQLK